MPGHSSLDVEHIDVYRGVSVIQNEFYGKTTVGIGNLTILNFLKIGFQMVLFSKGQAKAKSIAMVPTIGNQDIFGWILNGFFYKTAAFCPYFLWSGFRISDPIRNPEHLETNLFLTIQKLEVSGFQLPTTVLIKARR